MKIARIASVRNDNTSTYFKSVSRFSNSERESEGTGVGINVASDTGHCFRASCVRG